MTSLSDQILLWVVSIVLWDHPFCGHEEVFCLISGWISKLLCVNYLFIDHYTNDVSLARLYNYTLGMIVQAPAFFNSPGGTQPGSHIQCYNAKALSDSTKIVTAKSQDPISTWVRWSKEILRNFSVPSCLDWVMNKPILLFNMWIITILVKTTKKLQANTVWFW